MNAHYQIINQCLQLLKQSDIVTIKKLRAEIQLIQIKRLLLKEECLDRLECGPCSMHALNALLCDFKKICNGGGGGDAVGDVMQRAHGIIVNLSTGKEVKPGLNP